MARLLKSVDGSRDIRIERLSGQQALTIDIDRQAIARFGLNVADVQAVIETAIGGKDVTTLYEGERRYSVTVRAGLPSTVKESLSKSADFTVYVRDRKPFVRFTAKAYVLPRTGQRGIPIVTVNTKLVKVAIHRIEIGRAHV